MTIGLRRQRTLAAPPDRVWRALTDPAALAGWLLAGVAGFRPGLGPARRPA
jgi:uncharacterized protein YndB with AHSA1/START domain